MKWIVIGISGPTCSGKTSVTKQVQESLENSVLINQDNYFLPIDDPRHTLIPDINHCNWEILSSLDMEKMHSDMINIITSTSSGVHENVSDNKCKFLIIEGFSIFNYEPIANLCHQKYFIDLSKDLCWERRRNRVYDPPDVPGYFDKIVWPEHLKHKSEITSNENLYKTLKILNGSKNINELCNEILKDIKPFLY